MAPDNAILYINLEDRRHSSIVACGSYLVRMSSPTALRVCCGRAVQANMLYPSSVLNVERKWLLSLSTYEANRHQRHREGQPERGGEHEKP